MSIEEKVIHKSDSRGYADYGWLKTFHTFSFGNYYDPERVQFGALRVLNDDTITPSAGFPTHGHANMEIITIPLYGSIAHKDSTGTDGVIQAGEVQIMSAGTGIYHSEFNPSNSETLNLLQIWVLPKLVDVKPRYAQKNFPQEKRFNQLQTIVSPDKTSEALWINQNAFFHLLSLEKEKSISYSLKDKTNGTYFFIIDGEVHVEDERLTKRDGIGFTQKEMIQIFAQQNSEILIMEVPMV